MANHGGHQSISMLFIDKTIPNGSHMIFIGGQITLLTDHIEHSIHLL